MEKLRNTSFSKKTGEWINMEQLRSTQEGGFNRPGKNGF